MNNPSTKEEKSSATFSQSERQILLVDDDEFMRYAISFRLREEGFLVRSATDGEEALKIIRDEHNQPDLILLDLMMPHVSGFEFLHLLREKYSSHKPIPIIIMSSLQHKQALAEDPRLEGFHFVEKPFELEELIHWVNHFLAFGEN